MQCPGWCWDDGDGRTGPTTEVTGLLAWRHGVVLGKRGVDVCPLFEGSAALFRRRGASAVRERAAQCNGTDTGHAAQRRTVAGMASPGSWRNSAGAWLPGASWCGFVFDLGAYKRQCIKCPCRGSRYGGGGPARSSSEAEPRSRGSLAPEWGGTSLEGVTSPWARWNLTRGGDRPSSEAEVCQCAAAPLERSRVLPEGDRADCLVGRWGHQGRGPVSLSCVRFRFICVLFFAKVSGFPWLFRGPLWPSPTI
jgi:hypothetical protein